MESNIVLICVAHISGSPDIRVVRQAPEEATRQLSSREPPLHLLPVREV